MQYNCQKSSNFQGLSQFSRIFGKNDKIPGFFQAGKTVTKSTFYVWFVNTCKKKDPPPIIKIFHGKRGVKKNSYPATNSLRYWS